MNNVELKVQYRLALADYKKWWSHVDVALRGVVASHAGTSQEDIYVNVVMIDGIYRAQLSRTLAGKDSVRAASEAIYSNRALVMPVIMRLRRHTVLSQGALSDIVRAHQAILTAVSSSGVATSAVRSFASKFLHFYSDIVPIYDSLASGHMHTQHYTWSEYKRAEPQMAQLAPTLSGDREYVRYALRFLSLFQRLETFVIRPPIIPKVLDHMLWRGQGSATQAYEGGTNGPR